MNEWTNEKEDNVWKIFIIYLSFCSLASSESWQRMMKMREKHLLFEEKISGCLNKSFVLIGWKYCKDGDGKWKRGGMKSER